MAKKRVIKKKKVVIKKRLSKTREKAIYTRAGKPIISRRTTVQLKKSVVLKSKTEKALSKSFDKKLKPEFEKFYKKNAKKGYGKKYIFRIKTQHNLKGKRIKSGYSGKRVEINSQKELKKVFEQYKKDYLKSMDKYLNRKDMNSISIQAIEMEVVREKKGKSHGKKRIKTDKRRRAKKK